jgi:hypothetical protein
MTGLVGSVGGIGLREFIRGSLALALATWFNSSWH